MGYLYGGISSWLAVLLSSLASCRLKKMVIFSDQQRHVLYLIHVISVVRLSSEDSTFLVPRRRGYQKVPLISVASAFITRPS